MCDARADIQRRLSDLAVLTLTTASIDKVTNNLNAIRDDLETIAAEQGDLAPERRQEVEDAGKRFSRSCKPRLRTWPRARPAVRRRARALVPRLTSS